VKIIGLIFNDLQLFFHFAIVGNYFTCIFVKVLTEVMLLGGRKKSCGKLNQCGKLKYIYAMETTRLTPTTKELIYHKINACKQEIRMIEKGIESAQEKEEDTYGNKEFIEFWYIEIEMFRNQIDHLKKLLFNN